MNILGFGVLKTPRILCTLAAASVGCEGVALDRAGAVEAPAGVVASEGTDVAPGGQGALVNI
jgi:hypothetical protein